LRGERGPVRDVVALNAGAALVAVGIAQDLKQGATLAQESIDSGAAAGKLDAWVELTRTLS
jgi:anthranilate phosphoribosyltransferase